MIKKLCSKLFSRIVITGVLILIQAAWFWSLFTSLSSYAHWLNPLMIVLSVIMCAVLIRQDSTAPEFKISWMVLFMIMSVQGGLLYLLWGDKRPAFRLRKKLDWAYDRIRPLRRTDPAAQAMLERANPRAGRTAAYLRDFAAYPVYSGTNVKFYASGEAAFPDLLEALESAQKSILLEFFIISKGKMWDAVHDVLRRKAAQGVDVRLIYDDFGSLLGLPSDFVIRMEKAHIRCIPFNPVVPLVSLVMNHRDHRKIVVVDGNVAYTGGVNLADEYINAEQRFGYWKDAAIRLEGAAVWNFTVMFLNVWNAFRPQETDYTAFAPTRLPAVQDGVVQPYADSPLDEEPLAETVYLDILSQAQRYVYIYTPYLAVGEEMLDALKSAAKRGVDVRLILPGIPDKKLVFRLSRSYYLPLLRAGVRIYEFTPGFLHAKCYVSDDRVAAVGSINMDYRSMFLHFECGVLLLQNSQVLALRDDVRRTLPQCREVQCADCRTGLAGTVLDSVLRLLSPLM